MLSLDPADVEDEVSKFTYCLNDGGYFKLVGLRLIRIGALPLR
jgi:hypothetical protein